MRVCPLLALVGLAVTGSGIAAPSAKPKLANLPFQTIAKGTNGPHGAGPPTPAALIAAKRSGFLYVNAYAGGFNVGGFDMAIKTASIVNGRLQLKADLTVPLLFGPGFSLPYQFIRIKRTAIAGKAPQTAYLVQVQHGLKPHTSVTRLISFAKKVGGRLVSATLVRRYETVQPWAQGGGVLVPGPVWYLRCVGNLQFGNGLAPTGFYLVDDSTGQAFGGGYP
jgi:hypothetical protein